MAGIEGLYTTICLLLACIPFAGKGINWMVVACMMAIGCSYFLAASVRMVSEENMKYRKTDFSLYRELCLPIWYRVLSGIARISRIVLLLTGFYWSDFAGDAVGKWMEWYWYVLPGAGVILLIVLHHVMMRHNISVVDMGDYNWKAANDKAVEYEY